MADSIKSIIIVGAGQAGGWCAKSLRDEGFAGKITLIGNEGHPPHERPPLSKSVLSGAEEAEVCLLFNETSFADLKLDFLANDPVLEIHRTEQAVSLQSGTRLEYDALVLAIGGQARILPNLKGDRVHVIRSISDSLRLRQALAESKKLLVLGGGWIGLEAASTAAKQGLEVTVVEALDRLCTRSVPLVLSDYLLGLHQKNGVNIHLNTTANDFIVNENHVQIHLETAQILEADHLLIGIGLVPETELATKAGLDINNGIVVDADWRSNDPKIFAIGDAANRHHKNQFLRLESWANAMNSATAVAKVILGKERGAEEIPWFWSDQYEINIQILGVPEKWVAPVLRGELEKDACSIFFEIAGLLVATITINQPRDMMVAKRLMARKKPISREQLADLNVNLKSLLK